MEIFIYRELNPMYEGYLQHDAQEVLQCILGNIQETCQLLKKEEVKNVTELSKVEEKHQKEEMSGNDSMEMDNMKHSEDYKEKLPKGNGKRKSDTEFGNMKKKLKSVRNISLWKKTRDKPDPKEKLQVIH